MQDPTFHRYEEPADVAPSRFARIRTAISTAIGALVALGLLLALGIWFYRLGVRDAQNVPIIRAAVEPTKVRPDDPGGAVAPHQNVSSYDMADSASASAAAAVIAPTPAVPRRQDLAMGKLETAETAPSAPDAESTGLPPSADETAPDDGTAETTAAGQGTAGLAANGQSAQPRPQPLAVDDGDEIARLIASLEQPSSQTDQALSAVPEDTADAEPEAEPVPGGSALAPVTSPRVQSRPANLRQKVRQAAAEAERDVTNLASRASNSRIQIQLMANPSENVVRSHWRSVYAANKDILRNKALAVQTTQSGGTTFYRLRVGPFASRNEAAAICEALKARGQDCIVTGRG